MSMEFRLPDVGEGIHEGILVEWMVQEGDTVGLDQPFAKVETDKAIVELPSPYAGTVVKRHFETGDTVHVGDVMVTFSGEGDFPSPASKGAAKAAAAEREPSARSGPDPLSGPSAGRKDPSSRRPLATPHTRAYARKLGVDLAEVTPTGKHGRITDDDVDRALKSRTDRPQAPAEEPSIPRSAAPAPVQSPAIHAGISGEPGTDGVGAVERVPVTNIRKLIAKNMTMSKQTSAHVTHVDEADVTDLFALYQRVKARFKEEGIRFTILPLFLKAAAVALKQHPLLNASHDPASNTLILKKYYNIGIAVDAPDGLVVPVIRNVDQKDMLQLAAEIDDLAQRARTRRLTLEELQGGSFTITNMGPLGGVFATPIIRQPELAILGLHAIKDRPAVHQGEIVIRRMMNLSISFDHRFVDGADSARFMRSVVELVETPDLLLMRLF